MPAGCKADDWAIFIITEAIKLKHQTATLVRGECMPFDTYPYDSER